jgi:hypothetical protein
MIALESSEHNATGIQKDSEEKKRGEQYDLAKERYGFTITLIEDNSIHVRDWLGNEVAFEFPLGNIDFDKYDSFLQQMQNKNLPLPPIESISLAIHKPLADISRRTRPADSPNSQTYNRTWEQLAQDHGISIDEMLEMHFFAREALFARFKARLRDRQ